MLHNSLSCLESDRIRTCLLVSLSTKRVSRFIVPRLFCLCEHAVSVPLREILGDVLCKVRVAVVIYHQQYPGAGSSGVTWKVVRQYTSLLEPRCCIHLGILWRRAPFPQILEARKVARERWWRRLHAALRPTTFAQNLRQGIRTGRGRFWEVEYHVAKRVRAVVFHVNANCNQRKHPDVEGTILRSRDVTLKLSFKQYQTPTRNRPAPYRKIEWVQTEIAAFPWVPCTDSGDGALDLHKTLGPDSVGWFFGRRPWLRRTVGPVAASWYT